MAWLDTVPVDKQGRQLERRRTIYAGPIPEAGPLYYLFGYLTESGPLETWQEIKAWSELNATPLEPWEARILRNISIAHVNEQHRASAVDCFAPWSDDDRIDEKAVADKTKAIFG